jgi:hypothetical protein
MGCQAHWATHVMRIPFIIQFVEVEEYRVVHED